jgi:hypothetical protein
VSDSPKGRNQPSSSIKLDEGTVFLWLLRNPRAWVHRRVETCAFVDDRWSRRWISIDCTPPEQIEGQSTVGLLDCVPLALLAKRPLRGFDLRDADGRALSVLTSDENTEISYRALAGFAGSLIEEEIEQVVLDDLRDIVSPSRTATLRGLASMYGATEEKSKSPATKQRRQLISHGAFASTASELGENFLLLTPLCGELGVRRIYKYGFEDPLERQSDVWRGTAARLGLTAARLVLELPAARSAGSFHCEIEAPPDLEITKAKIDRDVIFQANLAGLDHKESRRKKRQAAALNRSLEPRDGGGIARAHLRLPRTDLEIGPRPTAIVWLRSRRIGFLRPALVTCLLTSALLIAARQRLAVIEKEVEPASTLILIIPGLLAAYLSRPGEHALASSLLVGVRVMLALCGLCAVTAAALLLAELCLVDLGRWWSYLRDLSVLATVSVMLANLLPISHMDWSADADQPSL